MTKSKRKLPEITHIFPQQLSMNYKYWKKSVQFLNCILYGLPLNYKNSNIILHRKSVTPMYIMWMTIHITVKCSLHLVVWNFIKYQHIIICLHLSSDRKHSLKS